MVSQRWPSRCPLSRRPSCSLRHGATVKASRGHCQRGVDGVSVSKRGVKELESDFQFTFNNSSLHNVLAFF